MSHFTREHSNSARVGEKLGKYVAGFARMIPVQEFEALQRRDPDLKEMSAPAWRRHNAMMWRKALA